MWITHAVGNNYGKLAGNPCKEYIRFRSGMVPGLPPGDAHVGFKVVDGPFYDRPYLIEGIPFNGIPLDAWEHAEVHVFVSIGGAPFFFAVLQGSGQSQTHSPFTMWTLGQIHLSRSERPFS